MELLLKRTLVCLLSFTLVWLALPRKTRGGGLPRGSSTADEAAAPHLANDSGGLGFNASLSDTTEYEFPEDEGQGHLYREIAVWVIVSAFVAFFIIKVFLEGDKEEEEKPPPGKPIPTN